MALLFTGCAGTEAAQDTASGVTSGQETLASDGEVILLEPEGTANNYEPVTRKNLYKAEVFSATVDFAVTEYAYTENQSFTRFGKLPGNTVSSGDALVYGYSKDLEKQIEQKQESIEDQEESHEEYVELANENLEQPLEDKAFYYRLCEEYKDAADHQQDYELYGVKYQDTAIQVKLLEEELRQHNELYELDHAYALSELALLQEKKEQTVLRAGAVGTVVAIASFDYGAQMVSRTPIIAVGNLNEKRIHCDYISKAEITKATEVYAFFDGKRYEITYEPMAAEDYNKRVRNDETLFSTFHLNEDTEELQVGDYGLVALVTDKREDVLAISKDSIHKDADGSFVYRNVDGSSVYTPVETGMSDGVYTEIVSGLSEGDRILSGSTLKADKETMKLTKGSLGNEFKAAGYLYYPSYDVVTNPIEYGTCYFVESLVTMNQQVAKGEALATVYVMPDQVELQTKLTRITRIEERKEDLRKEDEKEKDRKKKREIAREIKKLDKEEQELNEEVTEMQADYGITQLVAPFDGIVISMTDYDEEKELYQDEVLFVIAATDECYLSVKDEGGILNYGNEVTITYEDKERVEHTTTGTVVSTNGAFLSAELRGEEVLVRLSAEDVQNMALSTETSGGYWNRSRMEVTCTTREVKDVLLIPKKAVTMMKGQTYVKVRLDNGDATYVSFVSCGSDQTNYGVLTGLTEGMEICFE